MRRGALIVAALLALVAAAPFDPFGAATIDERPGARVPIDLPFAAARGGAVTLRAVAAGKPLLLVPVLHDCPNFCGVTAAGLARAVAAQRFRPGRDFNVALFGIDPRETRAAAAHDAARLRDASGDALGAVAALTGTPAAVATTTAALGYRYAFDPRVGQYAHAAATAVLTPDGRLSRWIYGIEPTPAAVERAIAAAQAGRTGGLVDRLILLCYHYDASSGRYTLAIERVLQALAAVTLLALGTLIWRLRRRAGAR